MGVWGIGRNIIEHNIRIIWGLFRISITNAILNNNVKISIENPCKKHKLFIFYISGGTVGAFNFVKTFLTNSLVYYGHIPNNLGSNDRK